MHTKFGIDWTRRFGDKNKGELTFDLHLHSEDDIISTWFYYVI